MNTALVAGVIASIVGFSVFLVIHHFWIKPIWFILPAGLVIAVLGGLAVGWSYAEIKSGLPPRPWTSLAMFGLVTATLLPGILLAQLRPPPLDIGTGAIIDGNSPAMVVARFVIELLLTATLVGGLAGWFLGGTRQAALATAVAGLVFALGPGHNIPFLGNTPAVGKGIVLLIAIIATSAVVLVESHVWLNRFVSAQ